ncbi:MAG TPA: ABC transporter permease, partial [Fimbriimonadaceae bacterium]|nr:ABC transporter permease [Fimbriimonadaceae bacterium]
MRPTGHIFRKEMREMLRDKRVLSSAVIGPVFLIVLFLMLFGFLQKTLTKPKSQTLHVVRTGHGEAFAGELEKKGVFKIEYVDTAEAGEKLVRDGKAKAVLYVPDEIALDINAGKAAHLKVTFDPDQPTAPIIIGQLGQMVAEASKARVAAIMDAQGLDKALAEPIVLDKVEIKKEKAMAGQMIVGLLATLYGALDR